MKKILNLIWAMLVGGVIGSLISGSIVYRKNIKSKEMSQKHLALMLTLNEWLAVKQNGINLASYFEEKNIKRIAIYGMSYLGESLLEEFSHTDIQVSYAIDQNADNIFCDIDVVKPTDILEPVDAIVVTAVYNFREIEEKLRERYNGLIINLEDVIRSV